MKMEEKKLEQIEQCNEVANSDNVAVKDLSETLQAPEYPQIILSQPDENSPKIRTYYKNNSYFATKGTCRSDRSQTYSIQDLVTIETSSYCSPDWRDYGSSIDKINLFPSEEDLPEEYDDTTRNQYWSWQYDYLSYDKGNERIWSFSTGNNLASQDHYFWVSPDPTILFPWVETVQECNGWYFHHIILDNQSDYKYVDKPTIQETINALYDQKIAKEKLEEYRKKYGDLWLELSWTEYSSWYYEPRVYMWDKHWTPAHEYSNERWNTNSLLVKFGKPWDYINFYRWWEWYTICIDENKEVDIWNHTSSSRCNNQHWWYDELYESDIQPWQIFINGVDVYEDTVSRITGLQNEKKENRKNKFTELKVKLINECKFTESEFRDLCRYSWKWKVLSFLSTVVSMMETSGITKNELFAVMDEIEYNDSMVFQNYVFIRRKAKKFRDYDVKRIIDKWYAWAYLWDNLPWIQFVWYFDDAMAALKLALDKGLFRKGDLVYTSKTQENTISDLWQALVDAGVVIEK